MQGKHMVLQLEKKPPISYPDDGVVRPDVAVVLRVEAVDKEGLLHRLVDLIRSFCRSEEEGGGASLEQYGLRGHTGSAVMEFLLAGASVSELVGFSYRENLAFRKGGGGRETRMRKCGRGQMLVSGVGGASPRACHPFSPKYWILLA